MIEPETARRPLVAVATTDPLAVHTFSGYSHHLFSAIAELGHPVTSIASRDLRWYDALTGAVSVPNLLRPRSRSRPRIRPDWYWSTAGFRRFSRRFDRRLARLPVRSPLLQVGTHVRSSLPGTEMYCVTDVTVVQAVANDAFAVSRASRRTIDEAVAAQREVLHACVKVFTLSRWTADSVVQDLGVDPTRVVVVGAGANLKQRLARDPDRERPIVLFIGADWEQKGGPLLLEAFRLVRRKHPTARLVVVGCNPPITDEGVEIVGFLDRIVPGNYERLLGLYARAACFALLSVVDAFPNVLLEAGYAGVPVVALDEGSRREVVEDGFTGRLVGARDPEAVAAALNDLLADPAVAEALGRRARDMVEERFTWPSVARRVVSEMGLAHQTATPGASAHTPSDAAAR